MARDGEKANHQAKYESEGKWEARAWWVYQASALAQQGIRGPRAQSK